MMMVRNKLLKRMRNGEIVVSPSDKGKGVVAMDRETYDKIASTHTNKDLKVELGRVRESTKECSQPWKKHH